MRRGALEAAYANLAQMRDSVHSRANLMRLIDRGETSWRRLDRGEFDLEFRDALKLARLLGTSVPALFEVPSPSTARMLAEEDTRTRDASWNKRMTKWRVPLRSGEPADLAEALAHGVLRMVLPDPREYGLEHADLIDGTARVLAHAGALRREASRHKAAAALLDHRKQLRAETGLQLIWGRYVERFADDGEIVAARRILVVKLSRCPEEPDFTVDRRREPLRHSYIEEHADRENDLGLAALIAWGGTDFLNDLDGI